MRSVAAVSLFAALTLLAAPASAGPAEDALAPARDAVVELREPLADSGVVEAAFDLVEAQRDFASAAATHYFVFVRSTSDGYACGAVVRAPDEAQLACFQAIVEGNATAVGTVAAFVGPLSAAGEAFAQNMLASGQRFADEAADAPNQLPDPTQPPQVPALPAPPEVAPPEVPEPPEVAAPEPPAPPELAAPDLPAPPESPVCGCEGDETIETGAGVLAEVANFDCGCDPSLQLTALAGLTVERVIYLKEGEQLVLEDFAQAAPDAAAPLPDSAPTQALLEGTAVAAAEPLTLVVFATHGDALAYGEGLPGIVGETSADVEAYLVRLLELALALPS